jgi:uncharacterized RDD family membrane protein YckC
MSWRTERILPPEGVPVSLGLAGGGSRFGAQTLDILLTFGGLYLALLLLLWIDVIDFELLVAMFFLAAFFLRIPYYIFSELVWNGRTLGKRIVGIRVISADGTRLTPHQIVARNLMKEVEVFMPMTTLLAGEFANGWVGLGITVWMLCVLAVPLLNRRRQRLGDMIAGTIVVEQPRAALLPDLAAQRGVRGNGFVFDADQLNVYGRFELQTLEKILRERSATYEAAQRLTEVVQAIRDRIRFEQPVAKHEDWDFLNDFYRQQREFLESRQLFGDTRENKFHARGDTGAQGTARRRRWWRRR